MTETKKPSILFVCMGNICRSPTVEYIARQEFEEAGFPAHIESAGTEDYHIGKGADPRSHAVSRAAGYPLDAHRARQVSGDDFRRFDYILAMDNANMKRLRELQPADGTAQVALLLDFVGITERTEVPDPYYGGQDGFDDVLSLTREAVARLIQRLQAA